jgi:hypothetical protein
MSRTHMLTYGRFVQRVKQRLNDFEQNRHLFGELRVDSWSGCIMSVQPNTHQRMPGP